MGRPVVIVRVYITESRARLTRLLHMLRDSGRLRGVTVYRGIAGFGSTTPDGADVTAPSDPPVVIEFFDHANTADESIRFIKTMVAPHHVLVIPAEVR